MERIVSFCVCKRADNGKPGTAIKQVFAHYECGATTFLFMA